MCVSDRRVPDTQGEEQVWSHYAALLIPVKGRRKKKELDPFQRKYLVTVDIWAQLCFYVFAYYKSLRENNGFPRLFIFISIDIFLKYSRLIWIQVDFSELHNLLFFLLEFFFLLSFLLDSGLKLPGKKVEIKLHLWINFSSRPTKNCVGW